MEVLRAGVDEVIYTSMKTREIIKANWLLPLCIVLWGVYTAFRLFFSFVPGAASFLQIALTVVAVLVSAGIYFGLVSLGRKFKIGYTLAIVFWILTFFFFRLSDLTTDGAKTVWGILPERYVPCKGINIKSSAFPAIIYKNIRAESPVSIRIPLIVRTEYFIQLDPNANVCVGAHFYPGM
jgi:hypothetical protein